MQDQRGVGPWPRPAGRLADPHASGAQLWRLARMSKCVWMIFLQGGSGGLRDRERGVEGLGWEEARRETLSHWDCQRFCDWELPKPALRAVVSASSMTTWPACPPALSSARTCTITHPRDRLPASQGRGRAVKQPSATIQRKPARLRALCSSSPVRQLMACVPLAVWHLMA